MELRCKCGRWNATMASRSITVECNAHKCKEVIELLDMDEFTEEESAKIREHVRRKFESKAKNKA